jgi:thioredoxin reductase (NADPH)
MRLAGTEHLDRVIWRGTVSGAESEHPIRHLFLMTGASPASEWLKSCLALDSKGSF